MNYNFDEPQRQSATGIVIMAADTLQKVVRALILPVLIYAFRGQMKSLIVFCIVMAAVLVLILLFSYLSYRRFTFHLDRKKQEFIIRKGIFNRSMLTIQLSKIQQVNINQTLLQKLIGIYSLQIDTPGDKETEVSIKAITEEAAYQLKHHLLHMAPEAAGRPLAEVVSDSGQPIVKLSASTLFKVGITSNYGSSLGILAGFMYAVIHQVKEVLKAFDSDSGQLEEIIKSGLSLISISLLIFLLLIIILTINLVRTYVKYFDFEISRHKHSLLITSGLFAKKNTLLRPEKVQIFSYSQNYFQQKLDLINLSLKQAQHGEAQNDRELRRSNLEVPGCSRHERDMLLTMILGKIPAGGQEFRPDYRFLNLPIFFRAGIPLAIFYGFYTRMPALKTWYPIAIAYFILATLMIYISYKRHRLKVSRDFIIKKSGIWDISNNIIVPYKIQAITAFQYPWHKKADVGHVNLHTAAGTLHFKYGNYTEIRQLVNYWLYQVESDSEEWM